MFGKFAPRLAAACAATAAMFALAAPAHAGVNDFTGQWVNEHPNGGVTRVIVNHTGPHMSVEVFGDCHPHDCDWGQADARFYSPSAGGNMWQDANTLIARYDDAAAHRIVILHLNGDRLDFEVYNDFTDGSHRTNYIEQGRLRHGFGPGGGWGPGGGGGPGGGYGPGGGGPGGGGGGAMSEDCVGFNPAAVQVVNVGGRWKIAEGSHWILDFAGDHGAAVRAFMIIQGYHLNAQCFIRRPNAQMTYWKSGGGVPSGNMPGQDCINVNPGNVSVQRVGPSWKVVDGGNWLLDFGADQSAAQQAADTIHHYHMNRQCFVARPNPPMQYWLGS